MSEKTWELSTRIEAFAVTGIALENAMAAQLVFANHLMKALIEAGALSPEGAEDVLLRTARAVEKNIPEPANERAAVSLHHLMVLERTREHAAALRGIARKYAVRPPMQKAS